MDKDEQIQHEMDAEREAERKHGSTELLQAILAEQDRKKRQREYFLGLIEEGLRMKREDEKAEHDEMKEDEDE